MGYGGSGMEGGQDQDVYRIRYESRRLMERGKLGRKGGNGIRMQEK